MRLARIDLSASLHDCSAEILARLGLREGLWLAPGGLLSIPLTLTLDQPELCQEYLVHLILRAWARPCAILWHSQKPPPPASLESQAWVRICPPCPPPEDSPTQPAGPLQEAYLASSLHTYHQHYFQEEPHPPSLWPDSYDQIDPRQFPACISIFLRSEGNFPGWQQESGILHFTRGLLGMGWHPRHIAGLIWSKLSHGQTPSAQVWKGADERVRCYSGLIHEGLDRLADFDCISVQNQGFCPPNPQCPVDLCQLKGHLGRGGWHP